MQDNPTTCGGPSTTNAQARKRSIDSPTGPCPFTSIGEPNSSISITRRADTSALREYQSNADDPFNAYKTRRLSKPRMVLECSVEDPSEFVKRNASAQDSLSPAAVYRSHSRRASHHRLSSPRQHPWLGQFSTMPDSPATPTTGSFTDFTPPTSAALSRQSSSICGGISMMKINSHTSNAVPAQAISADNSPLNLVQPFFSSDDQTTSLSQVANPQSQFQSTDMLDPSWFPEYQGVLPMPAAAPIQSSVLPGDTIMKRSSSSETNQSASSNPLATVPRTDES